MKHILYFFFFFISLSLHSQIQKKPKAFKKIVFKYKVTSNLYLNEKGIHGDTLLLKINFPDLKFIKTRLPNDPTILGGLIPIEKLNEKDKDKIKAIFSKGNYELTGYYDPKKNKTRLIRSTDESDQTNLVLKKHLDRSNKKYIYKQVINYKKERVESYSMYKIVHINDETELRSLGLSGINTYGTSSVYSQTSRTKGYPSTTTIMENINDKTKSLVWHNSEKNIGEYQTDNSKFSITHLVLTNPSLDKQINPFLPFRNCENGIQETKDLFSTTKLISVTYE
ncbi:hypothetical protein LZZ90_03505 [Flavobacterium sp. SM15]|uniref:hypothetical protein n=1 Tax=Flavobacterium sp. SM15 TaxID=2908005 RepID=UPI001EDC6402|nr:hypothetical protein [Flavobacterium sp. SM15]MCG2610571.1 hypothetical protein [Flavobacterium sp. SM15]